jgi:hypothetical protein
MSRNWTLVHALPSGRADLLAGGPRVDNVKNNDPSLIEPIAVNEPA